MDSTIKLFIVGSKSLDRNLLPKNSEVIQKEFENCIELNTDYYKDADIDFFHKFAPESSFSVGLSKHSYHEPLFIDQNYYALRAPKNHHDYLEYNGLRKIKLKATHQKIPTPASLIFPTPKKHLLPQKKICFLDRDGVLIEDTGYPFGRDVTILETTINLLKKYQKLNYEFIVITNQSGIARGYFEEKDYLETNTYITESLKKNNIDILDWYFCPYHKEGSKPYQLDSIYRKPMPGMILKACEDYSIDLSNSIMIGDKLTDNLYIKLKQFHLLKQ